MYRFMQCCAAFLMLLVLSPVAFASDSVSMFWRAMQTESARSVVDVVSELDQDLLIFDVESDTAMWWDPTEFGMWIFTERGEYFAPGKVEPSGRISFAVSKDIEEPAGSSSARGFMDVSTSGVLLVELTLDQSDRYLLDLETGMSSKRSCRCFGLPSGGGRKRSCSSAHCDELRNCNSNGGSGAACRWQRTPWSETWPSPASQESDDLPVLMSWPLR